MGGSDGIGQRDRQRKKISLQRQGGLRPRRRGSSPVDQLHRQEQDAVRILHRVDGDDVGVVQRGDRLRLALEAGAEVGILCWSAAAGPSAPRCASAGCPRQTTPPPCRRNRSSPRCGSGRASGRTVASCRAPAGCRRTRMPVERPQYRRPCSPRQTEGLPAQAGRSTPEGDRGKGQNRPWAAGYRRPRANRSRSRAPGPPFFAAVAGNVEPDFRVPRSATSLERAWRQSSASPSRSSASDRVDAEHRSGPRPPMRTSPRIVECGVIVGVAPVGEKTLRHSQLGEEAGLDPELQTERLDSRRPDSPGSLERGRRPRGY